MIPPAGRVCQASALAGRPRPELRERGGTISGSEFLLAQQNLNRRLLPARPAAFVLAALLVPGCGGPAPQPDVPVERTADSQPQTDFGNSVGQRDESLTPDEYARLGLPAHDREWSGADMAKAEKVLSALAAKTHRRLPRFGSERSGPVFARLTSPRNLELYRDRSLPLGARFPQAMNYMQVANGVNKLYLAGFIKKEVRDCELVELVGSQYRTIAVVLDLVDEFLPTIDKNDPSYPARMQGLDRMTRGLATTVAGGLQTLTERQNFRPSELARLVGHMRQTFPRIVPRLPPASRTETLSRLDEMRRDPAAKDLQPGLTELDLEVREAAGVPRPH